MEVLSPQQRRFRDSELGEFADGEDEDQSIGMLPTQRYRVGKKFAGRNAKRATGNASRGTLRTMVMVMLVLFGVGILYRVWRFSVIHFHHKPLTQPFVNKTMVEFTTKAGSFVIELYPEHAPKTVEHFRKLVDAGFYSDEKAGFYRYEINYVLQGGTFLFDDKQSPLPNLPVEYSLPSEERMVVLARGKDPNSGNSEFAIMLNDNTAENAPTEDNPGYTVFGRVVSGWPTIENIASKAQLGFLPKEDRDRQMVFDKVSYVTDLSHPWPSVQQDLESLRQVIQTRYTVVIVTSHDSFESNMLKKIFIDLAATVRVHTVGDSPTHFPYEVETLAAMAGTDRLPLVFVDGKLVGGLDEIKEMQKDGSLQKLLEKAGVLASQAAMNAIKQHPLVVFSKSYCPYCKKAKETLAKLGAQPHVFELDLREDGTAMQEFLFRLTRRKTVPNVFIKGKSIGGGDDTQALFESGELEKQLRAAGAIP